MAKGKRPNPRSARGLHLEDVGPGRARIWHSGEQLGEVRRHKSGRYWLAHTPSGTRVGQGSSRAEAAAVVVALVGGG
jgi:hypothetical protein